MPFRQLHIGQYQDANPSDNDGWEHHFEDGKVLETKLIHDHVVVGHFATLQQPAKDKTKDDRQQQCVFTFNWKHYFSPD